jgi:hypothetical protein
MISRKHVVPLSVPRSTCHAHGGFPRHSPPPRSLAWPGTGSPFVRDAQYSHDLLPFMPPHAYYVRGNAIERSPVHQASLLKVVSCACLSSKTKPGSMR